MTKQSKSLILDQLTVGQHIGTSEVSVSRIDLIKYAGASGDFNPIHWNERFAKNVGLPNVIAHGMFTMGTAVQVVTDWLGNPADIIDYQARFTRPVEVEDLDDGRGTALIIVGTIGAIDVDNSTVRIDLKVTVADVTVLAKAQVVVRIP